MHSPPFQDLPRMVSADLQLRRASTLDELEAVLQSHVAAFDDEDEPGLRANLFSRPGTRPEDVLYVEDNRTSQVVSSVSLIPQTWTYEGIPFRVAEAAIVSTREAYRKRGLVREQFEVYHGMALQAGCLVSVIAGIPYFYRQFGYEYIIPMDGSTSLRPEQIPDVQTEGSSPYSFRAATAADMPVLQRFYGQMTKEFCVASVLTDEIWLHQDSLPDNCGDRLKTYVMECEGEPVGYVRMRANERSDWHKGASIHSAYLPGHDTCLATLRFAKKLALEERQEHHIKVEIPIETPLVRASIDLGGEVRRPYAWQVRVLDPLRFLLTIAPALERRLAESPWAGLTQDFSMSLYREVIVLRFRDGRLSNVGTVAPRRGCEMRCPPSVIPMIWLCYRSVDEVVDWYPDASCKDRATQRLAGVLFPKRESWACSLF